ncbi:hypothetical protein [Streptomyces bluensis]|uniref:hypothetical protein n=1 Tax=Streptomyces bluensis TaxID=33897 RepID=UPI001673DBE4|nr:hypothetical protein [Streptomyces bluensis]GGZ96639.1 hypothetical protein GCM10010344_75980 [Streptomyces bluensis]
MRMRKVFVSAGIGAALVLGGAIVPAAAAPSPSSASQSDVTAMSWYDTEERFNRLAPCDTRGQWWYDTYWNVYDWQCRWNSANRNYQLWVDLV